MAQLSSKQRIANLIQGYEAALMASRSLYGDKELMDWAVSQSNNIKVKIDEAKQKLKDDFGIDYDAVDAPKKLIKEGSEVEVLVNHMDGMKGSTAMIKSYSSPAMLSDIKMNGMMMDNHKWLTNEEVRLK